jgi:hypothetical protein
MLDRLNRVAVSLEKRRRGHDELEFEIRVGLYRREGRADP